MPKAINAIELLTILNKNRSFINAVFESNHRQMNIHSVMGLINDETLDELEKIGLVEVYQNEVLLGENLVKFLESHLIDNFDEELYDYKSIFIKIAKSIENYNISLEAQGDLQKHLRSIHRHLRRIPSNLLDSLKSLQRHVEFTYRSAATSEEKLQELKGYNEMLEQFYKTLNFISRELKKHKGFFSFVDDTALNLQKIRVGDYILTIRDTLIKTTQTVLDYIRDTEKSIHFHKHIVELKELRDRKEIRDKTNMYELLFQTTRDPILSGFTKVEKKNISVKFYPSFADEEEFVQRLNQNRDSIPDIGKIEPSTTPIDAIFLEEDEEPIINYAGILYAYIDKEYTGQSFLSYLKEREPLLEGVELLGAYMDTIISHANELVFVEPYEDIGDYACISAFATDKYTFQGNQ